MKSRSNIGYKLSFVSASLFHTETIRIAEFFIRNKNWDQTKLALLEENLLQRKKEATIIRQFQEIRHRIKALSDEQLYLLLDSNSETQKLILFLAVCKVYRFIAEFVIEVIRQKYILFDNFITESDYNKFFDYKSAVSPKLFSLSYKTKEKIKRVTFTILWQSGLINSVKERIIVQPFLLPRLIEVVVMDDPELLKIFLVSDTDIKNYVAKYGK